MVISTNTTFWINMLIFNELIDICPTLNLNGEDRQVYEICCGDFKDYLAWFETRQLKIGNQEIISDEITQNFQDTEEMIGFIKCFISMWWRKWQERVKIILNSKDMPKNVGPSVFSFNLTAEEREELTKLIINKLIQYGEISCIRIMSDSLLKKALMEMGSNSTENKLRLISKLQRQAREVSYAHGSLVFLQLNNIYFGFRKWREDSNLGL